MNKAAPKLTVNKQIFYPTIIFLLLIVSYSILDNSSFIQHAGSINKFIIKHIGGLFTWSAFLFLIILLLVYFSPLGKIKIGGDHAVPLLSKWQLFTIALCTTVATGILFWGTAEPLYHLHQPPNGLGIPSNSSAAANFAMSTMFMHWSFTPYGIYTIAGLMFALMYYNYKQSFSISSLLFPVLGKWNTASVSKVIDIVCLIALVAGMSASLGTGIFALMGGLETALNIPQSNLILGIIGIAIVGSFIASAVSGLKKGIKILSKWNARFFFVLAILIFILGPSLDLLKIGFTGFVDYGAHFLSRSTNIGSTIDDNWLGSWTIFYFANWFAWAPVAALFLGRIALGYTVKDFIKFNLIFPSIFTCIWMMIFSGIALEMDMTNNGELFQLMKNKGEENVMFFIFSTLPFGKIISIATLIIVFISYVTAADSNISAMSGISTNGISPDQPEAPIWIKIIWGSLIGTIALVMITSAGIDGIRMLSVMGGTAALLIIILVGIGLLKLVWQQKS